MDGLNSIQLSNGMLESMYGHALVDLTPPRTRSTSIQFLGGNLKNIAVLVDNPEHSFLPDEQLAVLNRMLLACKLNTGDVAIVNTSRSGAANDVLLKLQPKTILAFGVSGLESIPMLSVGDWRNTPCLNAPSLSDIADESEEARVWKGTLWKSLQNLFAIV